MAPTVIQCLSCRSRLRVDNDAVRGQIVPCPKCGNMVDVPLAEFPAMPPAAAPLATAGEQQKKAVATLLRPHATIDDSGLDLEHAPPRSHAPVWLAASGCVLFLAGIGAWWARSNDPSTGGVVVAGTPAAFEPERPNASAPEQHAAHGNAVDDSAAHKSGAAAVQPRVAAENTDGAASDSDRGQPPSDDHPGHEPPAANSDANIAEAAPAATPDTSRPIEELAAAGPPPESLLGVAVAAPPADPPRGTWTISPEEINARLDRPVAKFALSEVPLPRFLRWVERTLDVPVALDAAAFLDQERAWDVTVSAHVQQGTWREVLNQTLTRAGCDWTIAETCLVVQPSEATPPVVERVYDLRPIVGDSRSRATEIVALLSAMIAPDSWAPAGAGEWDMQATRVVVRQSPAVHRRIAAFFAQAALARTASAESTSPTQRPAIDAPCGELLAVPVQVNFFRPTSLIAIADWLEQTHSLQTLIDWPRLAEAQRGGASRLIWITQNGRLADGLDAFLQPQGLGFRVLAPGVIEITSRVALIEEPACEWIDVRPYFPASQAVTPPQVEAWLADLTERSAPAWEAPPTGAWHYDAASRLMLVRQPHDAQRALARLLRESLGKQNGESK